MAFLLSYGCSTLQKSGADSGLSGWSLFTWDGKGWVGVDRELEQDNKAVIFARKGKRECIAKTFTGDIDETPMFEIETGSSNCHWRLTAEIAGQVERVLADCQMVGICRRNVRDCLGVKGSQQITIRLIMWGWGGSDPQSLVLRRAELVAGKEECDANKLGGIMLPRHKEVIKNARTIRAIKHEHPSLRYRRDQVGDLRERARTTHRIFAGPLPAIVSNLDAEKDKAPYRLEGDFLKGSSHAWRGGLLQLLPPEPPDLGPNEGAPIFGDASPEGTWRVLSWHVFSLWVIGASLTDDPVFSEQARRWILAMARWQFWKHPGYVYFDFATSYALQNFAFGYDIAYPIMTESEREEVRSAIASLARGLYLNTLSGHGAIYNDLRGNHTAVTMCGLGMAGLVLLEEHPEAAQWIALAEEFLVNCFNEHTSGAWTESPSYGQYGVDEWLKLAEMIRNVTGRDHMTHPFFTRYADFSLMVHDWEGRNLGYNGGGWASRWNHWIFFRIAAELKRPDVQWLANFCLEGSEGFTGYGDAFWWVDPELAAQRPTAINVVEHYADVGISIWRSGWDDRPTILLHHCGRKGQHKEENMNHVTLYVRGKRLLSDGIGGRTVDHNVPVIGGKKQNKWGPGSTLTFHSDEIGGYALGDATHAYGTRALRHVFYLRSGVLVLVDDIALNAKKPVETRFVLHPQGVTRAAGDGFEVVNDDVRMLGAFCDAQGRALEPTIVARVKARNATHDVSVIQTSPKNVRTITVLRFGLESAVPGGTIEVIPAPGHIDFNFGAETIRVGTAPGKMAEGVSSTGTLWVARCVDQLPVDVLATTGEGQSEISISAGENTVSQGAGCVSWSATK